jgi:hypothetical protein
MVCSAGSAEGSTLGVSVGTLVGAKVGIEDKTVGIELEETTGASLGAVEGISVLGETVVPAVGTLKHVDHR